MVYESTRDNTKKLNSADIILQGISDDGGLFVPSAIPEIDSNFLLDMVNLDYRERAKRILALFLTDYTEEEISRCVDSAYDPQKFSSDSIAPVIQLTHDISILELWHGPTCAFKDMALQLLPHLMRTAMDKKGIEEDVVILVATSGDTGKAALEGFKDVEGTHIVVFYPLSGVSRIQELQMTTQEGSNVYVLGVAGNFDDAQTGVKRIFTHREFNADMKKAGYRLSSANSINWGRLVPQIIYYVSAYIDMIDAQALSNDETFDVVVPTGNFGNILAAYYAKQMGIPIDRLICASNRNNILTDFISSGIYDSNRKFYKTISPSMDILISSNLERLLYEILERNDGAVSYLMDELKTKGKYELTYEQHKKLKEQFWGGYADDRDTLNTIKSIYHQFNYVLDPHTAVGMKVLCDYREAVGGHKKALLVSTASPYKFIEDVLIGIGGEELVRNRDEFEMLEILASMSNTPIPESLRQLKNKEVVHTQAYAKENMEEAVAQIFNIGGVE